MPIDPRAYSDEKLVPPPPLPYISRKALKRVKNPLPAPTECRYCHGPVALVENSRIYRGRSYGDWPYAYYCEPCGAHVGLHPNTDIPLGTLANWQLRQERKHAKNLFHRLKDQQGWSRTKAYEWLAKHLGLPVSETHFGWFDHEQCSKAADFCAACLGE